MKVVGKKDFEFGSRMAKMAGIYFFVLALVLVVFINNYNQMLFICLCISLGMLIIERVVALLRFRRLPVDLITMHRNYIEVKSNYKPRAIKYKYIREINVDNKRNKMTFIMSGNEKVVVKYCQDMGVVRREILDYKEKYIKD